MNTADISLIIPARNEERLIEQTLEHVLSACRHYEQSVGTRKAAWEVIVVDNNSSDGTLDILKRYEEQAAIQVIHLTEAGAARARNAGRKASTGRILVFVDADTMIPQNSLIRIAAHCSELKDAAGITSLGRLDGGMRSSLWWWFWNTVRLLPLPKAKAMPALMFCTASTFDALGPFDEEVAIGEEWPILAGLYRILPQAVIYDRSIVARSSSRRMEQRAFGYTRTLLKYVWAILHRRGRVHYPDTIR